MNVGINGLSFAHRLRNYLQEADYRVAINKADKEAVYRLRYDAYLKEDAIEPNSTGLFRDDYDDFDNCWIFTVHIDDQLVSSMRFHVISRENRKGPALDVFPDLVSPMIERGETVIDPTRFVADMELSKKHPETPYLMLRVACMASEFFNADHCLATVRKEHAAFYRRVFKSKFLSEPRPYPTLKKPICLLSASLPEVRERMVERYPCFQSSLTERRMLFETNKLYDWRTHYELQDPDRVRPEHYFADIATPTKPVSPPPIGPAE